MWVIKLWEMGTSEELIATSIGKLPEIIICHVCQYYIKYNSGFRWDYFRFVHLFCSIQAFK